MRIVAVATVVVVEVVVAVVAVVVALIVARIVQRQAAGRGGRGRWTGARWCGCWRQRLDGVKIVSRSEGVVAEEEEGTLCLQIHDGGLGAGCWGAVHRGGAKWGANGGMCAD